MRRTKNFLRTNTLKQASAYVYLNDSGPVLFKHVGKDSFSITRPATKTGSFRLFRAVQEIHEVENKSELPSDFLRVEFKTEPKDENELERSLLSRRLSGRREFSENAI